MQTAGDECRDPTLKEMLSDAIVGAMMKADRVDRHELEAMLARVAREMRQPHLESQA
jgi:hypothetical protein